MGNKGIRAKFAICQMNVRLGYPYANAEYMIGEIRKAHERGMEIIVFPEMCVPGYLIGDKWEDDYFIRDCMRQNERIIAATAIGICAIFGSVMANPHRRGEDGRMRKSNCAIVAQNGRNIFTAIKTLQPNYRMFDDGRHFFSLRQVIGEENEQERQCCQSELEINDVAVEPKLKLGKDHLHPVSVNLPSGAIKIGVMLCEDGWPDDYAINPGKCLVENGAELLIDISASPWGWQKNRKRHSVISRLIEECKVPCIYVNNTGIQNNGKNIIVFDGSSTAYDCEGRIVFEAFPYTSGAFDFSFTDCEEAPERETDDTQELFDAVANATRGMLGSFPEDRRNVVIGVSGGIDSAVSAALHVHILGRERVALVYMPSEYSSSKSESLARALCYNLGVKLAIIPITGIVKAIAKAAGAEPGTLEYENIQARARGEVQAAIAQKRRGVFPANGNKVELALGYGTLYGDMAGYLAPLGDLIKREVYQVGKFLNEVVFGREVIPAEIFERRPTAELASDQFDPFDYGTLACNGYHDQMVRAFVDFRLDPEWFLEKYLDGSLESELKLDSGRIARLFPDARSFVNDLEKNWSRFGNAVFKRVQAPPIPIVSKRAFGFDLRESMAPAYFTDRYIKLKDKLLS